MLVWGRDHSLKKPCIRVLDLVAMYPAEFFTDAEVLQEIHRYTAIGRWAEVQRQFESFASLFSGHVEPMHASDVEQAASFAATYQRLSARDLVHLAVMQRVGSQHIVTADGDFDGIEHIQRLDPADVEEWRSLVTEGP
jgi:uncharacterized protein